jgi:phosphoserine aminotransferase
MSRVIDTEKFGLIYAGAQKNIGPSGVCLAIIREDMLSQIPNNLPSLLDYSVYVEKKSLYNTPPCFGIYVIGLVLKWLEESIGGVEKMEEINRKKADILYNLIDSGEFYKGTAQKDSRSKMNVTFRLPNEELEQKFIAEALQNDLGGLKGHRTVGGCRASIYNAATIEAVETLASFMKEFERKNG